MHTAALFAIRLALARLLTHWRSLLTVIAGTILAASIGALIPLYTSAVAQVGMLHRLDQQPPADVHLLTAISLRASKIGGAPQLDTLVTGSTGIVKERVAADLGTVEGWVDRVVPYTESAAMGFSVQPPGAATPQPLTGVRAHLAAYDDWQAQVKLAAGQFPQDPAQPGDPLDVAVSAAAAAQYDLDMGSVIVLDQTMNERGEVGRGHASSRPITARITGIVAPRDPGDAYWIDPSPLRVLNRQTGSGVWDGEFVFLTTQAAVLTTVADYVPDTTLQIGWRVLFAHENLPFGEINTARAALQTFERNLAATFDPQPEEPLDSMQVREGGSTDHLNFRWNTRLIDFDTVRRDRDDGVLLAYHKEVARLDAPFGLLLLQVGALVLFFLMVMTALVRRGERREIAMFKTRGARDRQIMLLRGVEAALICVLALLAAPLIARELLVLLGPVIANTDNFPLPLVVRVYLFTAVAVAITFVALLVTLIPLLRQPLILAGGAAARSPQQPWWQRVYLDVMLAVVGTSALWFLGRQGSPLADLNLGGQRADPLILLAPALLVVALGSIALRLFPLLTGAAARLAAARRGLDGVLAGWQISRESLHYGRITFLLALAVGIGWFATSFRATLLNSLRDQADYTAGTDVRFTALDPDAQPARPYSADFFLQDDNVTAASVAYRVKSANLSLDFDREVQGDVLAVDAATFADVALWRGDLGTLHVPGANVPVRDLPVPGEPLPFVPQTFGLWIRLETLNESYFGPSLTGLQRMTFALRLRDSSGGWFLVPFELIEIETRYNPDALINQYPPTGWAYFEADAQSLAQAAQEPVRLVSVAWDYTSPYRTSDTLRLSLADLTLIAADGTVEPFPVFADEQWTFAHDRGALVRGQNEALADFPITDRDPREDNVYFRWQQEGFAASMGANLNYPNPGPVTAVVSARVAAENALITGAESVPFELANVDGRALWFDPVAVAAYYPTLFNREPTDAEPKGRAFMVVNVDDLLYHLNQRPSAALYADEVWLRLRQADQAHVEAALDSVTARGGLVALNPVSRAGTLDTLQSDPLGLGLMGLMYLGFLMALALSAVGLLTYAALTAQARRSEFGVLRALGLSTLRLLRTVALEQVAVMLIGVALGALLGGLLTSQVVPSLAYDTAGRQIIPPFVMRIGTRQLLDYSAGMLAVLLLILGSSMLLVRRLSVAQTLRLGDE